MFASNSGTKIGVVSDGELVGDDDAPVVVKVVQVGAEWTVGVVVAVIDDRGSVTVAILLTARVTVRRGERRQRSAFMTAMSTLVAIEHFMMT